MRSYTLDGVLRTSTRSPAKTRGYNDQDIAQPSRLAEAFRDVQDRLAALEGKSGPEAAEYALVAGTAGARLTVYHGFGSPVRWWVTDVSSAVAGPSLVRDDTSDANTLVLRSYVSCSIVLRIEPSQHGTQ